MLLCLSGNGCCRVDRIACAGVENRGKNRKSTKRCGLEFDLCQKSSSTDMYNNDVGKESAQKFMKQTGDLKAATLYFAS
jgi:hypothetical protein